METGWSAENSGQFKQHYETVRGYVRREVARENLQYQLQEFLSTPRNIIDVGGGEGGDAIWLADSGHSVVLIDPETTSLQWARKTGQARLYDIRQGTSATALSAYGQESFDLVLSHGVLLYLDNPKEEINRLSQLLKPGGYLSLLTAGKFGKINRFQTRGDKASVDKLLPTGKYTNNQGLTATAYLPQEVEILLKNQGFEISNWFGVRISSDEDNRQLEEVPAFHRNRILSHEIYLSRNPLHRPNGQMLHYVAKKILNKSSIFDEPYGDEYEYEEQVDE